MTVWSGGLFVSVLLCTLALVARAFVGIRPSSRQVHFPLSATATTSTTTVVQDLLRVNTSSSMPVYVDFEGVDELTVAVVVAKESKDKDKGSADVDGPGDSGGKEDRREPHASVAPAAAKKFFLPKALDGASPEEVWAWWQVRAPPIAQRRARTNAAIGASELTVQARRLIPPTLPHPTPTRLRRGGPAKRA